jgi:ABC-type nitrate/sulfonate/bicarbonate transport system substrate-binding protein
MSEALENEDIHLAIMLTEGSVKQIADGKPFKILQKYIATPLNWGIYVNPSSEITEVNELEKSTAAISRYGSGSHLMTYLLAKSQRWEENQLSFVEVNYLEGGIEAIQKNEASYFMWEHFTTQPYVENGIFKQIGTFPTPWPCFVIVVKKNIEEQYRDQINELLKIVNQYASQLKNEKQIEHKIAAQFSLKEEAIKSWLQITDWSSQKFTDEEHNYVCEMLKKTGIIKK